MSASATAVAAMMRGINVAPVCRAVSLCPNATPTRNTPFVPGRFSQQRELLRAMEDRKNGD
jgi:hypothetical protein